MAIMSLIEDLNEIFAMELYSDEKFNCELDAIKSLVSIDHERQDFCDNEEYCSIRNFLERKNYDTC